MKNLYAFFAIVGFVAPNVLVAYESWQTGNILFWLDPVATLEGMFGNRISAAFILDLIIVALIALVWMYFESKRTGMKNYWMYPLLTLLFGLGGPLGLFLYVREVQMTKSSQ